MDQEFVSRYILANFERSERLAVVIVNRQTGSATQRINSAEHIASNEFQAWLRHRNAKGDDIYLSMNPLKPEADRRTKENVGDIRHIYLDFDQDGKASVTRMLESATLPVPSQIVRTSSEKRHVIWRVEGFSKEAAEQLQRYLAHQWGADPAATDVSRVLRLPGFYNHKYGVPYRVLTEVGQPAKRRAHRVDAFPEVLIDRLTTSGPDYRIKPSTSPCRRSQSERDWAFAMRALARGESPEVVAAAIASYRRFDKHNPLYYAELTVKKASESLTSTIWLARSDDPERS